MDLVGVAEMLIQRGNFKEIPVKCKEEQYSM
jgi:hypothetical protein